MAGKYLFLAMLISAFIVVSMNTGFLEGSPYSGGVGEASLDINTFGDTNMVSFAVNNIIIFLILTGVVYFFVRSIVNSFGNFSGSR